MFDVTFTVGVWVQESVWDSLGEKPLRCPGQGQSGISLFDDAVRIGDRGVIAVAWIGRHLQPGGGGSPLGVPIVDVSKEALREAMTLSSAERAGTELERLLLVEADKCGSRSGSDQRDCSGAPARVFDQRRHQSMVCCRADRREPGYGGFVQRQP